jgi:ATP-dependent Clp protease ATP-binding subunit ClpC
VVSLALSDPTFSNFLMAQGVVKQDVYSATIFVQNLLTRELLSEQWWSTINLKRFNGIGEEWAYGGAWTLRKYAKDFAKQDVYGSSALGSNIGSKETDALETILARSHETNALLVGDDRVSISITLARLQDAISRNDAPKQLQYKKMLVLNGESLLASIDNQADFEKILVRIFEDASKAGNIILIFEELPIFSNNVRHRFALALDTLIDPYLRSDKIQIIATSSAQGFNREFGEDGAFAERFEQVFVRPVGTDGLVELLEARIMQIEKRHKIFFIYSAIRALADCAEEYSGFGSILDTALDLLDEAVVKAMKKHKSTITQQDISTLFEEKTGIPSGAITNIEREKLLNMETILHKRVIGQHSAIEAVAGAIRRARSGLASRDKPISSFLFLGSTGVGKTEVAKALAQAFFDGEDKMIRFDMSEYSGEDALERLIGSSKSGDPGMLANYLRQKPYGVVLFDEFEKANEVVHDLFLQILDEGFFSDMHGKRVSARNTIIIATSNAGSDYIWDIAKNNEDPSRHKDQIIKRLIDTHTFKPELINRFDATIVFHPLSRADLSSIAKILLHALQDKLAQKGYKFVITHEIVQFIVDNGYDPAFGARPMKRAISDILERYIAGRIIAGDIKPGESVQFSSEELRTLAS